MRCDGHLAAWALALTIASSSTLVAGTPPAGFVETLLLGNADVSAPVAAAYEPVDDHLWVLEKGGGGTARVRRRDAGTGVVTTAKTVDCVSSVGERGLLGIAFDPRYAEAGGAQRYVYLFYTRDYNPAGCTAAGLSGAHIRVSRFLESGGQLGVEEVLLEGEQLGPTNHNGGTLRFAPDGTLFISIGDNDSDGPAQAQLSRDLTDLRGKLLRIHADGSIPADNPFVGAGGGVREEIWAFGLRNHFRFGVDPWTGTPYLGDVGEISWEAVYAGISGADYGYPCLEGSNSFQSCNPALGAGAATQPIFEYSHGGLTPPVSGNSLTGGPVYRATAFPEEYEGNYFFGEYGANWIRRGRIGPDHQIVDVEMFMPDAFGVVDMIVSPAGCLTWVSVVGTGVRDVCPDSTLTNQPPRAAATADAIGGLAPLNVNFTGSASSDPDPNDLLYEWDFDDGSPTDSTPDPSHTYTVNGVFEAQLTVDDQQAAANSLDTAPGVRIVVGNRPPTASIGAPAAGFYSAGDVISYSGSASDPEDGALGADRLRWTVVRRMGEKSWPLQGPRTDIAAGTFTVPTTGVGSGVGALRVYLTATDLGVAAIDFSELADTVFVELTPNLSEITLAADPAGEGLEVALDGVAGVAPRSEDSVVASVRVVDALDGQTIGDTTWAFDHWSDAGAAEHSVVTPGTDLALTATYRCGLRVRSVEMVTDPDVLISGCDSFALGPDWRVATGGGATVEASDSVVLRDGVVIELGGELTLANVP